MTLPLFFGPGGTVGWDQFAGRVAAFGPRLTGAARVCNLAGDRHDFMVGLCAALLGGQTTVLPASRAPQAVAAAMGDGALSLDTLPDLAAAPADPDALRAALAHAPGLVHVFTSGSTGTPTAHVKTWTALAGGADLTHTILALAGLGPEPVALIGTTPHQHMFGLEATVFAGLVGGHALHRGPIFYPADLELAVAQAARAGLRRIALITSPAHLKFLAATVLACPAIALVISATAPLSPTLATRLEARGDLAVFEIFGSTETGSLALRRTAQTESWTPMRGFTLTPGPDGVTATAPHLGGPVLLGDAIAQDPDGRFRLLGRLGDTVHVAGKRTTLAALNLALADTPGLADGVVLRERTAGDDVLTILAVPEPGLGPDDLAARIRQTMRDRIDPIFVPHRIRFCDALPRSAVGKLAAADLERLARDSGA